MELHQNIIIGAGPAGLGMAGRLRKAGLSFVLLEKSQHVGAAWHQHYERLHLHTVKEHSALPHLPFPENFPRYVSRHQFIQYLELYAREWGIAPRFGEEVQKISPENGHWHVSTATGTTFRGQNIILATGYNRLPNCPTWPGQHQFGGEIRHSQAYRNGAQWAGKLVLVVGMGNSGAEIALDLYEHGAKVCLSVRSPVNIVPRDFRGRPTQITAIQLNRLPTFLSDAIAKQLRQLAVGDLSPYGLSTPPYPASVQVRRYGKIPVIDIGTIAQIKAGHIRVLPGIRQFLEKEIVFQDGQQLPFEAVILATGYRSQVQDFLPGLPGLLNDFGHPRALWFDEYPGLYFLGFAVPNSGILRSIAADSARIAQALVRSYSPYEMAGTISNK
ncbi:MAG: NAD(P)/FAD-dependent oxidoreductase [Microscillaceae bacterium]